VKFRGSLHDLVDRRRSWATEQDQPATEPDEHQVEQTNRRGRSSCTTAGPGAHRRSPRGRPASGTSHAQPLSIW